MTRPLILPGLCLLLILTLLGTLGLASPSHTPIEDEYRSLQRVLEDAADLVVLRVGIDQRFNRKVEGLTGGASVTADVRAVLSVGVDLTRSEVIAVDGDTRTVVLQLSEPGVRGVSIDHRATNFTTQRHGLWLVGLGSGPEPKLIQTLLADAQAELEKQPVDPLLIQRARLHAESVLNQLLSSRGWRIQVRWQRE